MNGNPDTWIVLDRIRNLEGHLIEVKDRDMRREIALHDLGMALKTATDSIQDISNDVSLTSSLVKDTNEQVTLIMSWSKRIALGAGLAALSFQHLTVAQMAKVIRVVLGI